MPILYIQMIVFYILLVHDVYILYSIHLFLEHNQHDFQHIDLFYQIYMVFLFLIFFEIVDIIWCTKLIC